jgi:hypothetical protein
MGKVPEIQAEPYVHISGEETDTRFSEISGLEYRNEEVYVTDGLSHNVRVFNRNGDLIRTFGRRGGGPGEMNYPRQILFMRDTLLVMDRRAVHRFTKDGAYISRATYRLSFRDSKWGDYSLVPQTFDVTPDGLVSSVMFGLRMQASKVPKADTISLFLMDSHDGSIRKPFQTIVTNSLLPIGESGHRIALFSSLCEFAIAPDGRVWVNARDGVSLDEYKEGKRVHRFIIPAPRRAVTAADVDSLSERTRRFWQEVAQRPNYTVPKGFADERAEGLQTFTRQKYFTATGKLIASNDGLLLMHRPDLSVGGFEYDRVYGTTRWDIISKDMKVIGRTTLPDGFFPMIMRDGVVLGRTKDENDVPSVIGYRLIPASSRSN